MLKKILAIACTIFMLGSISAFALEPTPVPTPVVRNGDFETAYTSVDWAGSGITLNETNLVTTHKHSGEKSLCLPGVADTLVYAKQLNVKFDFVSGKTYTLSVWYHNPGVDNKASAAGKVLVYEAGNVSTALREMSISTGAASTVWQQLYVNFTPAENLNGVDIWLGNYSKIADAPIYFDDISISEIPPLLNGDMESVTSGLWNEYTKGTTERVIDNEWTEGYCYKILAGTQDNPNIYNNVRLKTNTEYELSFYFKADSADGYPRVGIGNHWWYSGEGALRNLDGFTDADKNKPGVANTWVKCKYYFKTGDQIVISSNQTTPFITLYGLKGITCYYDKVELVEATNKIMLHDMAGKYGADVTSIKNGLAANTKFYAKGRFIPTATSTSAVLIAAVFDESTGTKQLQDVQVAPYTGTDGAAQTLETAITVENPATSSVEVYMWDSLSGMSRYLKKLRVAATE